VKRLLAHFRRPPWPALLAVSAAGYAVWLLGSSGFLPAAICAAGGAYWTDGPNLWAVVAATLTLNSPGSLMTGWGIMLVAMMPPLLAAPIVHVRQSSLVRRRGRALAGFVAGYAAVWLAMAVPLGLLALLAHTAFGQAAFPLCVAAALAWSASPAHRRLLNRAHRLRPISLFGLRADGDCFVFGIEHGLLCAATCWAWMLVPLLAGGWHYAAMVATGMVLLAERLSLPRAACWRLPPPIALFLHRRARAFPDASALHRG
jgi:predicted metal-binding membrane protein